MTEFCHDIDRITKIMRLGYIFYALRNPPQGVGHPAIIPGSLNSLNRFIHLFPVFVIDFDFNIGAFGKRITVTDSRLWAKRTEVIVFIVDFIIDIVVDK